MNKQGYLFSAKAVIYILIFAAIILFAVFVIPNFVSTVGNFIKQISGAVRG